MARRRRQGRAQRTTREQGIAQAAKSELAKAESFTSIELGSTGLKRNSGVINEEFLRQLRGRQAERVYQEMAWNDPTVRAVLFAIEMLLRNVTWRVESASKDNADIEAAEFLTGNMDDMSHTWGDLIAEVLSMLQFGWSYHEIVYKRRVGPDEIRGARRSKFADGKVGWRKFPIRAQSTRDRWEFDDEGGLVGMWQHDTMRAGSKRVLIPIEKAVLFRTTSHKNSPEGHSILRGAYVPWFRKKRIEEVEGIGIERDLAGFPVLRVPARIMGPEANADERTQFNAWKDIVRNIRRDEQEGLILPGEQDDNGNFLYELELLNSGGQRQFDTTTVVNRYARNIVTVVLADFIMLGQEKAGSFALSSDKTELFELVLNVWNTSIAETMNRHAVPRLLRFNAMQVETLPKLAPGKISKVNIKEFTEALQRISAAGLPLFPDPETENKVREVLELPERSEEAFTDPVEDDDVDDLPDPDEVPEAA